MGSFEKACLCRRCFAFWKILQAEEKLILEVKGPSRGGVVNSYSSMWTTGRPEEQGWVLPASQVGTLCPALSAWSLRHLETNSGWQQGEVGSQLLTGSVPIENHHFRQLLIHGPLTLTLPSHTTSLSVPLDFGCGWGTRQWPPDISGFKAWLLLTSCVILAAHTTSVNFGALLCKNR